MKKFTLLVLSACFMLINVHSQSTLELTFTAEYNGQYVPLDSILIENLTQGVDTVLYAPDTVLVLDYITSISDNESIGENNFTVSQNYPNPFTDRTTINIYLPEKEKIEIVIRDILGREVGNYDNSLNKGIHTFTLYPGTERVYLLTVTGSQESKTIKMLNANSNSTFRGKCKIVYTANDETTLNIKSQKIINNFVFAPGDQLRYIGYAKTVNEVNGSDVIGDTPETNELYELEITEGIPCPGTPTVTYEGQVYNTVLIGSQCWLKENLNLGTMILGSQNMEDNGVIEKYCYNDDSVNCFTYGGLYQWNEIMQYTNQEGSQGICPQGWHVPTDDEWKVLEGVVDSYYGVGSNEWDKWQARGFDVGLNLKSTSGWNGELNGTDLYGFNALPGGYGYLGNDGDVFFLSLGDRCYIWSSTEEEEEGSTDYATYRVFNDWEVDIDKSGRWYWVKGSGHSVRCLRNY